MSTTVRHVALALSLALIGVATLTPGEPSLSQLPALCLLCGEAGLTDFILNVVLFLPLGVAMRASGYQWSTTFLAVVLTTLAVESGQLFVISGRDASAGDIVANTIGGTLGSALFPALVTAARPSPALAKVLTRGALASWLIVLAATLFLWATAPSDRRYVTTTHPPRPDTKAFRGFICEILAGGASVAEGSVVGDQSRANDDASFSDLAVEVVPTSAQPDRAALVALMTGAGTPELELWLYGREPYFAVRTRAGLLRLRELMVGAGAPIGEGAPEHQCSDVDRRARIEGRRERNALILSAVEGGEVHVAAISRTVTSGWRFLYPFRPPSTPWISGLLAGLWIGAFCLPIGYWLAFRRDPLLSSFEIGFAMVAALAFLPSVTDAVTTPWNDWLAVIFSALLGWLLGQLLRRGERLPRAA